MSHLDDKGALARCEASPLIEFMGGYEP